MICGVYGMVVQALGAIDRGAKVHVAGHRGLVGSAIWRHLTGQGFSVLVGATSSEADLRHQWFLDNPTVIRR